MISGDLKNISNETIIGAIKDSNTMGDAAKTVGCSRQGLYYQMNKRGIVIRPTPEIRKGAQ